jgi:adenylate cyclase
MADGDYKRKLTAILSADVAGYSRLMGDDEIATVSTLKSHRNLISEKVQALIPLLKNGKRQLLITL